MSDYKTKDYYVALATTLSSELTRAVHEAQSKHNLYEMTKGKLDAEKALTKVLLAIIVIGLCAVIIWAFIF